mgnify:CR=1 FL=1
MSTITKDQFKQIIRSNILLPAAIFKKAEHLSQTFANYDENGANLCIAPTYLYNTPDEKREAFQKTAQAAQSQAFVCSAVAPPKEKTVYSGGSLGFDDFYSLIKAEASFLYETSPGACFFLFGFQTLAEAKYATFALKEVCDLPICVLLDFQDKLVLSDGFNVASSIISLQSLGISALGVMANDCDTTLDILLEMKEFASVPLFAFPGANDYITPVEYAQYAYDFVNNKCVMFGAGKGTDERFTAHIAKELWQLEPFMPDFPTVHAVCGKNQICFFDFQNHSVGKHNKMIEIDLKTVTNLSEVDVIIEKLVQAGLPPVCFSSKEIDVLERAVKLYPGRAAVKSDEYGEITAKEYGALILSGNKGES